MPVFYCRRASHYGGAGSLLALNLVALLLGRHARSETEMERIFELIGMQRHHLPMTDTPAYHEWTERLMPPHLAALDPAKIHAALARGAALDPDTVAPQLLVELEKFGEVEHNLASHPPLQPVF